MTISHDMLPLLSALAQEALSTRPGCADIECQYGSQQPVGSQHIVHRPRPPTRRLEPDRNGPNKGHHEAVTQNAGGVGFKCQAGHVAKSGLSGREMSESLNAP